MTILRDTLYSDKILAVLREYAANAWDANRMVGRGHVPIEIHLPTVMDPVLRISDSGPGISEADVFGIFAKYGSSTKRNDDVAVGMLGIGSKSGFAYADTFNIISKNGGQKKVYVAALDESDKGIINLLHTEDCGEETGLTIEIAIAASDINEVTKKAQLLYTFFDPVPTINTPLPTWAADKLKAAKFGVLFDSERTNHSYDSSPMWIDEEDGTLQFGHGAWFAQMGCIIYPIELEQITGEYKNRIPSYISHLSGIVKFDIGELAISASREGLRYTEATKKALATKLDEMVSEFVLRILTEAANGSTSPWDKKVRCKILAKMQLPIPKEWEPFVKEYVQLFTESSRPRTFDVSVRRHSASGYKDKAATIALSESNRLIFRDDRRSMKGYPLSSWDYIIEKRASYLDISGKTISPTWEDVRKELDKLIESIGLQGIPMLNISELPWTKPVVPKAEFNAKHKKDFFELERGAVNVATSNSWNVSDSVPGPNDPVLILTRFVPDVGMDDVAVVLRALIHMQKEFPQLKVEPPRVFAMKSTEKKPVTVADIKHGKHWVQWLKDYLTELIKDPEIEKWLLRREWEDHNLGGLNHPSRKDFIKRLKNEIGRDNIIISYFKRWNEVSALKSILSLGNEYYFNRFRKVIRSFGLAAFDAKDRRQEVYDKYPLLRHSGGFGTVMGDDPENWIEYFKLKDEHDAKIRSVIHDDQRVDHGGVEGKADDRKEGSTELRDPEADGSVRGLGLAGQRSDSSEVDRGLGEGGLHSEGQHVLPEEGGSPERAERTDPQHGGEERGSDASPELLAAAQAESLVSLSESALVVS